MGGSVKSYGVLLLLAACGVMTSPSAGAAPARTSGEDADTAAARAQFSEGLRALDEERWPAAAAAFERALALRPTAEIRYNLTTALLAMGRPREATRQLQLVLDDPQTRKPVRAAAEQRLRQAAAQLGHLRLNGTVSSPAAEDTGWRVWLDGEELPREQWSQAIAVDPGAHEVRAGPDQSAANTSRLSVSAGETKEVVLVPSPTPRLPETEGRISTAATPTPADKPTHGRTRWLLWGAGALAAGAAITLVAIKANQTDVVQGNAGHFTVSGP